MSYRQKRFIPNDSLSVLARKIAVSKEITRLAHYRCWENFYRDKKPAFLDKVCAERGVTIREDNTPVAKFTDEELASDPRYKNDSSWATYTPERKFYYPSQVTPFKASGKIAGTLFQFPSNSTAKSELVENLNLSPPDEFESEEKNHDDGAGKDEKSDDSEKIFSDLYLPELSAPDFSITKITDFSYSLGYSVSPDFTSQFSYSSVILNTPDDFDWNDMQSSYIQVKSPTVLTSKIGYKDSFLSLTDSFTFEPVYQTHPYHGYFCGGRLHRKFLEIGQKNGLFCTKNGLDGCECSYF